jgi:hypothetical protein
MERKPELRLPTVAVPVKLALIGREAVTAELFVADVARPGRSQLHDDIAAMLDEAASFFPVRSGDRVRLHAKSSIAWVCAVRHDDDDSGEAEFVDIPSEVITLYDRQHHVVVELASGGSLTGTLFDSSPSDRPRVIDHLNHAGRFLRLWTPDEHYLINKDQILHVSEQE